MARSRRANGPPEARPVVLDAGAVLALANAKGPANDILRAALKRRGIVFVPPVAIAETVRGHGPRDAPVNRVIARTHVPATTERTARFAGACLATAKSKDTIDALVVAHAIELGGAAILTTDPADLRRLAAAHPEVQIVAI